MADPRATVLPTIATPRERAIGAADAAVLDRDTDLIRRAGSPDIAEVPAVYLPARAEMVSVDVWDPLWPDDIKRAAIAAAPEVHRHKGTVYAVKTALSALKIDAKVTEWWQETPRGVPYTFTVTAYIRARLYDGPLLDARLIKLAYTSILRAKPLSRAFDFKVGVGLQSTLGAAPILVARQHIRKAAIPRPILPPERATLGLAPVLVARRHVRMAAVPRPALPPERATLGLAPLLVGRARIACAVVPVLPSP